MVKEEYLRLLKSKATLIILVLLAMSSISFFLSYGEKQMFVEQYYNSNAADLNKEALWTYIESATGIQFLFSYWFESELADISIITLYIWSGIFLAHRLFSMKESGWGSLLMTRIKYPKFLFYYLLSQTMYIVTVVVCTTLLQWFVACLIGGFSFQNLFLGDYDLRGLQVVLLILVQICVISFFVTIVNGISSVSCVFFRNKYAIQLLPMMFAILPMMISATLGNLSSFVANFIVYFETSHVSILVSELFQSCFSSRDIFCNSATVVVLLIIFLLCFIANIQHYKRDYI